MADTIRTRAALQIILADNVTGDISPQDVRDMLVSTYNWVNKTIGGDIYYAEGKVGIGDFSSITPDGTLHVHTATAGIVTADANADDLVIENSAAGGLSILTPAANNSGIVFGSPSVNNGAQILYNQNASTLSVGLTTGGALLLKAGANSEALRIDNSLNVVIGHTTAMGLFNTVKSAGYNLNYFDTFSTTDAETSLLVLRKSASATKGTASATANGEALGYIEFNGCSGGNAFADGARIDVLQDGAASTYVPANMIFSTWSGSAQNTNQLVLHNDGAIGMGTDAPQVDAKLTVVGNIYPGTDDTYYLGKFDDDTPFAWKGLCVKDTTDGKYYCIRVTNGSIEVFDLTD